MTEFVLRVESVEETLEDADELAQILDELAVLPNSRGTFGRAYWLGPIGKPPTLRVDLDPETGAGAVRWLTDDLIGIELGYEPRIVVVAEQLHEPLAWVPPRIARVSYSAARETALRYLETGSRPENLTWVELD